MSEFTIKVDQQDELIDMIAMDAIESNIYAKEAGKELKQAHEYQKGNGILIASIYLIMAFILLSYDWLTSY